MSNADTILAAIHQSSGLTDAELVGLTGIEPHQQVNQICNRLARNGRIRRERDSGGLFVNRPVLSRLNSSQFATLEATTSHGKSFATGMRPARLSDLEALDPSATLLVIACSGSKVQNAHVPSTAFGPSIMESLPENLANELRPARAAVRKRAVFDERTLLPALNRYSGGFYQAAGDQLARAVEHGAHVLIISGGYGVLTVREPIGWYNATFSPSWWPGNIVAECLSAYAASHDLRFVLAFLAASTGYARAFRGLGRVRGSGRLDRVFLVSAVADDVGGAMRKVPHSLGEAVAAHVRRELKPGWRSSDGLDLIVSQVR